MEKKKLNSIYYMTCNDEIITDKLLKEHGFTDEEIDFLLNDDRIYVEDDHYVISYMGDLLDFAKEKIEERSYGIANKAINKCYELCPDDFEVLTLMFEKQFMSDRRKNRYNKTIDILYKLRDVADFDELKDANCYTFLLSMLTELPDDLRLAAKYFKMHELTLNGSDPRFENIDVRNSVRKNIFIQKYSNALSESKKISDRSISTYAYDHTLIKMAEEVTTKRKQLVGIVKSLAASDKEDEILLLYEEEAKRRVLTRNEEYTIKLAEKLSYIRKSQNILPAKHISDGRFYDMIDNNDFKSALDRVVGLNNRTQKRLSSSTNYILLNNITTEIDNIKSNKNVKQKSPKNG